MVTAVPYIKDRKRSLHPKKPCPHLHRTSRNPGYLTKKARSPHRTRKLAPLTLMNAPVVRERPSRLMMSGTSRSPPTSQIHPLAARASFARHTQLAIPPICGSINVLNYHGITGINPLRRTNFATHLTNIIARHITSKALKVLSLGSYFERR